MWVLYVVYPKYLFLAHSFLPVWKSYILCWPWSMEKLAKRARIKPIASKFTHDFDCDWQRVNMFSRCVTLTHILLPQIISYSDTKVLVLVVMECKKHASLIHIYELIFLFYISRSTEYSWDEDKWHVSIICWQMCVIFLVLVSRSLEIDLNA